MEYQAVISQQFHRCRLKFEIVKIVRCNARFKAVHNIHHDLPLKRSQLIKRFDQIIAEAKLVARLRKW